MENLCLHFFPLLDFFDELWPLNRRPAKKIPQITYYPLSGHSSFDKRFDLINDIKPYDYMLLSHPDSVSWLLNIRDLSRDFTPVVHGYALINREGIVELFTDGSYEDMFDGVIVLEKKTAYPSFIRTERVFCDSIKKCSLYRS